MLCGEREKTVIPLHSHTQSQILPCIQLFLSFSQYEYRFQRAVQIICKNSPLNFLIWCWIQSKSWVFQFVWVKLSLCIFIYPYIFAINTEQHELRFIFRLPQHCLVANASVSSVHLLSSMLSSQALEQKHHTCHFSYDHIHARIKAWNDAKHVLLSQILPKHPPHVAVKRRMAACGSNGSQQGHFTLW